MRRVCVFAKPPVEGRVKTRLTPALPPALACGLYRAMLEDALEAARRCAADGRSLIWAEAPADGAGFAAAGFEVHAQQGADLGERLANAFAGLLRTPDDRAVVIGADCPGLSARELDAAFEALASRDAVLGPTRDGGYYLVGLRRHAPEIFAGIEWSTERVLAQTVERAKAAGLSVALLEPREDLDTPDDLVRLIAREAASPSPVSATKTARALRSWGLLPPGVGRTAALDRASRATREPAQ